MTARAVIIIIAALAGAHALAYWAGISCTGG